MTGDKKQLLSKSDSAKYLKMIECADERYTAAFSAAQESGCVDILDFWERLAVFCVIEHELRDYDEESTAALRGLIEEKMRLHRTELEGCK